MKKYLVILGFKEEEIKEMPKMKTDKGGKKEDFQKLQDALKIVGDMINDVSKNEDDEELFVRKMFKDFNFEKENMNSFTIFIENEISSD